VNKHIRRIALTALLSSVVTPGFANDGYKFRLCLDGGGSLIESAALRQTFVTQTQSIRSGCTEYVEGVSPLRSAIFLMRNRWVIPIMFEPMLTRNPGLYTFQITSLRPLGRSFISSGYAIKGVILKADKNAQEKVGDINFEHWTPET
jgi:hypothetical protein